MNEITITTATLPITSQGDFIVAPAPFIHTNRTAAFNVLIYVTKGQITVTEDEEDYEINEGELLFLKSGVHHYGKKAIQQGTAWYYVHFYTQECLADYPLYSWSDDMNTPPIGDEKLLYSLPLPKKLTGLLGSDLEQRIQDFIKDLHSPKAFRRWALNATLFTLLSDCAFYNQRATTVELSLSDKIALYLQEHREEPFKADVIEQTFFLSYKHMAAVFKKEKAMTMQQYHSSLRIQAACKLLRSTSLSIGEISCKLGYSDRLYFSRCFHHLTGISPSDYRKKVTLNF